MSFGHALYYPTIHLTNKNWLKHAFLFWDKISRIVPQSFQPQDTEDIIKIKQETNFIQDYHPDKWVISETFSSFANYLQNSTEFGRGYRNSNYSSDKERDSYWRMKKNTIVPNESYIHIEKIHSHLLEMLYDLGLAVKGENEWSGWIKIDNDLGNKYMSFLAKSISKAKSIPIVTDKTEYYITDDLFTQNRYKHLFEEKIGCLLIDVVLPKNINDVTMDQLINIKAKYNDQRMRFLNQINDLSSHLPTIDNKSTLEDALHHHSKSLAYDTRELKKIYELNGIDTVMKPLSISLPTSIVSLSNYIPIEFNTFGVGAGLLFGVISYFNELEKTHLKTQENPMAYLLSIHSELNRQSLFHKITDRLNGMRR